MSKYTPEQYTESARKHGITPGPYYAHKNSTTGLDTLRPEGFQITTSPDPKRAMYVLETVPYGSDSEEAQAIAHARLPDLLIALDEKDAEIERLRNALRCYVVLCDESLSTLESWSEFESCGFHERPDKTEGFGDFAKRIARAALKGGA